MTGPERRLRMLRDDAGAATIVSLVLMLPVLTLLLFAAVQAALWNHAH
jgi:Tfp pilus assembly protein PilX